MSTVDNWVINTEGLSLRAGYRYLLKDINWQVARGENWLIFGLNGSGKTTLLSILAGFKQGMTGHVSLFDQKYTEENILALRRRIGWVSSSFFDQLYTKEAVLDIVLSGKFGTAGLDYDLEDKDIVKAQALLETFHMGSKAGQPYHLLSKGERQNVLIARALLGEPELLMLDEPCSGLDILARRRLLDRVKELAADERLSIIYVTHHTEEILIESFPNLLLLRDGLIYGKGRTEELLTPDYFSTFLGYPVTFCQRAYGGLETVPVGREERP